MSVSETPTKKFTPPTRSISVPLDEIRARLTVWLAERFTSSDLRITEIRSPDAAGVNNETLLLDVETSAPELEQVDGLVVRLDAPTTLFPGMDIHSSYNCYRALQDEPLVPTPRVYGLEEDTAVLGRKFYVMERISGLIPADNPTYHQAGWVKDLSIADRSELWTNAIRALAHLHQVPANRFGFLRDMGIGSPRQQMDYWRGYLDADCPDAKDAVLEKTWDWLVANFPADAPEGFSWGDARVPNMIFRDLQCVGILDWDMVSLAGPEYDLAWWLVHDIAGSAQVGRLQGLHDARQTVRIWEAEVGRKAQNMEFWLMFNLFRLGAIMIRLKAFLAASGAPPEAVSAVDKINTAQSILHTRWGLGQGFGLGQWDDIAPAIDA